VSWSKLVLPNGGMVSVNAVPLWRLVRLRDIGSHWLGDWWQSPGLYLGPHIRSMSGFPDDPTALFSCKCLKK